jgi:hypothetical protein
VPRYAFPEPDLIDHLLDLYFSRINLFLPLLHRPTFEQQVRDKLYFQDQAFASVLLCVCACASRYSDDPRVLLEGSTSWHSSGWKWFGQVQVLRRSLMGPSLLRDVQMYAVGPSFYAVCPYRRLIDADGTPRLIHSSPVCSCRGALRPSRVGR